MKYPGDGNKPKHGIYMSCLARIYSLKVMVYNICIITAVVCVCWFVYFLVHLFLICYTRL